MHGTQVPVAVSQAGVEPVQAVAFVAEHWPQLPSGWQAAVAPPHWASAVQGTQVPELVSQVGVAPEQARALVAEH